MRTGRLARGSRWRRSCGIRRRRWSSSIRCGHNLVEAGKDLGYRIRSVTGRI